MEIQYKIWLHVAKIEFSNRYKHQNRSVEPDFILILQLQVNKTTSTCKHINSYTEARIFKIC